MFRLTPTVTLTSAYYQAHLPTTSEPPPPPPPQPPAPPPQPAAPPRCKCGVDANKATVKSETPNKGRLYFHCASRTCGFFAWADGDPSQPSRGPSTKSSAPLAWSRFPMLPVVSDFGFRAADLRQGGVGDCWFSARHR